MNAPQPWPFPPPTGPTPWTPQQIRDHQRQQPKTPPAEPAPW